MPNPNGNSDFGTKYRFDYGRDKPLTEQVKAVVYPEIKQKLKDLADKKKMYGSRFDSGSVRAVFS